MGKNIAVLLLSVLGMMALARNASGALSVDEQVKMLAERYRQVEDQLPRSIRYTSKDESGGATTVRQEWYNGCRGPDQGRSRTQRCLWTLAHGIHPARFG